MILPHLEADNFLSEKWTGFYAYHNLQGGWASQGGGEGRQCMATKVLFTYTMYAS